MSRNEAPPGEALLAQPTADDRLEVESGDVVSMRLGDQTNAGRERRHPSAARRSAMRRPTSASSTSTDLIVDADPVFATVDHGDAVRRTGHRCSTVGT